MVTAGLLCLPEECVCEVRCLLRAIRAVAFLSGGHPGELAFRAAHRDERTLLVAIPLGADVRARCNSAARPERRRSPWKNVIRGIDPAATALAPASAGQRGGSCCEV
jgi:hypothetical protein